MTAATTQGAAAVRDFARFLDELKLRGLVPSSYRCVYVSGSRVRGWANASSDLDFYVVCDEPWTSTTMQLEAVGVVPDTISVEITKVDDIRVDIEYWTGAQVDQVLAKVSPEALTADGPTGDLISPMEIRFLEKLLPAVPVEHEAWLSEIQTVLAASALRSLLASRALNAADILTEDAAGQVAAGDYTSAVLAARLAFGRTVDALLATHGEIVGGQGKWRARSFQAASPRELSFDDYWRWETMRDLDPQNPAAWVRDVLRQCQHLAREMSL